MYVAVKGGEKAIAALDSYIHGPASIFRVLGKPTTWDWQIGRASCRERV